MTLKHLLIFCTVCEENSMTKAAEKLCMTQPAVSRAVGELEKYYSVKLFDRVDHRLYLTSFGKKMWEDGKNVLLSMERLENGQRLESVSAELKVGCSIGIATSFMRGCLDRYYRKYPETVIRVTESHGSSIEEMVLLNELDLGLIEGEPHIPSLVAVPFRKDDLVAVCSPHHPLAGRAKEGSLPLSLKDLNDAGLCIPGKGTGTRASLEGLAANEKIALTPIWSTVNYPHILQYAAEGVGAAVLSRHLLTDYLRDGILVELKTSFHIERSSYVIRNKNKYLSLNAGYFVGLWTNENSADK
ncbi:MAG: LysR family transcriptional regulator [Synergistaceae bacterium]|nr:LysR family transcriptional regulator [Synergistaceae bacterium]